jgi:hypothetical protein
MNMMVTNLMCKSGRQDSWPLVYSDVVINKIIYEYSIIKLQSNTVPVDQENHTVIRPVTHLSHNYIYKV